MQINIESRTMIPHITPPAGAILISITSPDNDHPEVKENWKAVLRLKFDDIEQKFTEDDVLFSEDQAAAILDFVKRHNPSILWVNCDAGVSRSAGVAVALDRIFNGVDTRSLYPYHNTHVARTIVQKFGNSLS